MSAAALIMCMLVVLITTPPAASSHSEALNGIQLTSGLRTLASKVEEVKKQLFACQQAHHCPQAKRSKVAFSALFSYDDGNVGNAHSAGSTLRFDNVLLNVGDGYNSHNGIFTAPVAGLYVFSLTSMTSNTQDAASFAIVMQGTDLARTWGDGKHDLSDQSTKTVPAQLDKGDQVWVAVRGGNSYVRGGWWTSFSGFLVQADQ